MATAETGAREDFEVKALKESTICGAFQVTSREFPDRVAIRTKGDGMSMTWAEYNDKVKKLAAGLAGLGLKRGDTIGVMLNNRPEFHWVDAAAMHLGATPYSVYNTYSPEQIEYLVSDAQNAIVVTEQAYLPVIQKVKEACGSVEHVISVDGGEGAMSLEDLESKGSGDFDFEATWKAVEPDDVLTLIYTSGTTGPPKGVEVTHAAMLAELDALAPVVDLRPDDRILSYLPSAHLADRLFSHYQSIASGLCLTSLDDAKQLLAALHDTRPTLWLAVPRVWEKFKAALESRLD